MAKQTVRKTTTTAKKVTIKIRPAQNQQRADQARAQRRGPDGRFI